MEFRQGGPGPTARNNSDKFSQLILQRGSTGLSTVHFNENYNFPRYQKGGGVSSYFSTPKHMLWVLKRTVSIRRFF